MTRLRAVRRILRRRWRRVRYHHRYRLVRRVVLWGGGGLLALGILWIGVTALLARNELSDINNKVVTVRRLLTEGRLTEARRVAGELPDSAAHAEALTSGPAWWIGAHIPYAGDPLAVARAATSATGHVCSEAVPRLIAVARRVEPNRLRDGGSRVRLAPLASSGPLLRNAEQEITAAAGELRRLPTDTWLDVVDVNRARFAAELESLRGYVVAAERASRVLPRMLGADGHVRRYFIGLQNEAEMRGTGGLPGAFAIARVRDGTITFERFASDTALLPPKTGQQIRTGLDFGREFRELYGKYPTQFFVNSNVSPHFPYAAQVWAAMWEKQHHQRIDGAVAIDPTVLSYFLAATGPAQLPSGRQITAEDVVPLTESENYRLFPDNAQRKAFLVSVLRAASKKLTSGSGSAALIALAGSQASKEGRLQAWTRDPTAERLLQQTNYAGALPAGRRPFSAMVLNNAAAGKLDYYVQRSVTYSRTGCGPRRDVRVTMQLTNTAPPSGLPPYVTDRLDRGRPKNAKPGDTRTLLDYFATRGALLESVTVDGAASAAAPKTFRGLSVFRLDLELPRGTTTTVVMHLDEPAGAGPVRIWKQPGVSPLGLRVVDQTCN